MVKKNMSKKLGFAVQLPYLCPMKIQIKLSKKQIVAALGNGVRQIALADGNGGFQRKSAVHKNKKLYNRKQKKYLEI
jgi:hypothetical protein